MASINLKMTPKAERTLVMVMKVGVVNNIDVSNKSKQANLALELLGTALSKGAITPEAIKRLLSI